jgi:dephospho-CoA kinase
LSPAVITTLGRLEAGTLPSASARAHLVLGACVTRSRGTGADLTDAMAWTDSDLSRFIEQAQEFDRRRLTHQLPPDTPPIIDAWSPRWAEAAARVGARVEVAFQGFRADVEHIGSTSVPELPAKSIIDLQVGVADLEHCDSVDSRLKEACFVNVQELLPEAPGVRSDNARGADGSETEWAKRLYASVDSRQRVIVHVRRAGAANWRYALLFRDWLRTSPGPRDEYAAVKTSLAAAHGKDAHFDDYARAKDFWFERARGEMESWARTTGWSF